MNQDETGVDCGGSNCPACPCTNEAGQRCRFPFVYDGSTYHGCTTAGGYDRPWCYDVRGNSNWDYCVNCGECKICPDREDSKTHRRFRRQATDIWSATKC